MCKIFSYYDIAVYSELPRVTTFGRLTTVAGMSPILVCFPNHYFWQFIKLVGELTPQRSSISSIIVHINRICSKEILCDKGPLQVCEAKGKLYSTYLSTLRATSGPTTQ